MVSYAPLWETLRRKGLSQYRLEKTYGISRSQIARMKRNEHVSTSSIEILCRALDCNLTDVVEITNEG